jgi:hypothetical protein
MRIWGICGFWGLILGWRYEGEGGGGGGVGFLLLFP